MPKSHPLLQGPPAHSATGSVFVPGPRGVRMVEDVGKAPWAPALWTVSFWSPDHHPSSPLLVGSQCYLSD